MSKARGLKRALEELGLSFGDTDSTRILPAADHRGLARLLAGRPMHSLACNVPLDNNTEGRALICLCAEGTAVSVTVRASGRQVAKPTAGGQRTDLVSAFGFVDPPSDASRTEHAWEISGICKRLSELVLGTGADHSGLVVVAGATNSGKSIVARGLVHLAMEQAVAEPTSRKPHLVTFEDPIEVYFDWDGVRNGVPDVGKPPMNRCDYTPRQRGVDYDRLEAGLQDALRQTPTVVYIGEIRDRREWRCVLELAATGHLVITTSHAASVAGCLDTLMAAVGATTQPECARLANRVRGVIHMRQEKLDSKDALVPSLWRRTPASVNELRPRSIDYLQPLWHDAEPKKTDSYFGRAWFASRLSCGRIMPTDLQEMLVHDLYGR